MTHFFLQIFLIFFVGSSIVGCLLPGYEIMKQFSLNQFVRENAYEYFLFIGVGIWLITFHACLFLWQVIVMRVIHFGQHLEGTFSMTSPQMYQFLINYVLSKYFNMTSFPSSGTPFVVWMFRLMGAKVGAGTFIFRCDPIETFLIEIGKDCILADDSHFSAHSFRNKKLRRSFIKVGDRCVIQGLSTLRCGTTMEDDSTLLAGSEPFIGTRILENSYYFGLPAEKYGMKEPENIKEP